MTDFKFYLPNSNTESTVLKGSLVDKRNFVNIILESDKLSQIVSTQVIISRKVATSSNDKPTTKAITIGNNFIGPQVKVTDINYAFQDNTLYNLNVIALLSDGLRYEAKFGADSSYLFLYRADGGDKFKDAV